MMRLIDLTPDMNKLEKLSNFAHEGIPYMDSDESWLVYDTYWDIHLWWDRNENAWRASAYRTDENGHRKIDKSFDLF